MSLSPTRSSNTYSVPRGVRDRIGGAASPPSPPQSGRARSGQSGQVSQMSSDMGPFRFSAETPPSRETTDEDIQRALARRRAANDSVLVVNSLAGDMQQVRVGYAESLLGPHIPPEPPQDARSPDAIQIQDTFKSEFAILEAAVTAVQHEAARSDYEIRLQIARLRNDMETRLGRIERMLETLLADHGRTCVF